MRPQNERPLTPQDDVRRVLEQIRLLIYLSPLNQRQVEHEAGFSKGYLSQIIYGNIDLKYRHLIKILSVSGVDPEAFFRDLFPEEPARLAPSLERFQHQSRPLDQSRRARLARLYGLGLASLDELFERLDRCEDAFAKLEARGILEQKG